MSDEHYREQVESYRANTSCRKCKGTHVTVKFWSTAAGDEATYTCSECGETWKEFHAY